MSDAYGDRLRSTRSNFGDIPEAVGGVQEAADPGGLLDGDTPGPDA